MVPRCSILDVTFILNIVCGSTIFKMKVTSKIEHLGTIKHNHESPLNIEPTETQQLSVSASKYYEDNRPGTLKINEHIYSIVLDEDVYDVDGLIRQLHQKLPFIQFAHQNNT